MKNYEIKDIEAALLNTREVAENLSNDKVKIELVELDASYDSFNILMNGEVLYWTDSILEAYGYLKGLWDRNIYVSMYADAERIEMDSLYTEALDLFN